MKSCLAATTQHGCPGIISEVFSSNFPYPFLTAIEENGSQQIIASICPAFSASFICAAFIETSSTSSTNTSQMFYEARLFNYPILTPYTTNTYAMFYNCKFFNREVSLGSTTNAAYMFYGCSNFSKSVEILWARISVGLNRFKNLDLG